MNEDSPNHYIYLKKVILIKKVVLTKKLNHAQKDYLEEERQKNLELDLEDYMKKNNNHELFNVLLVLTRLGNCKNHFYGVF